MPASLVDADSLLAVDVGTVTTRAALFDVVEGYYRFVAAGHAPSTANAPFKDVSEGMRQAIEDLQTITGRVFLDEVQRLIMPSQEGKGVDSFAATISAGPVIKTVVAGLLDDVSVESAQRLARTTYARVVDTIRMNDKRKMEEQIDALLRLTPDLVLIAGGTDDGAARSVQRLMETVGLACYLLPADKRPAVLFAGNKKLAEEIKSTLQPLTSALSISPNLRPTMTVEDLKPAQHALARLCTQIRAARIAGVEELNALSGNTLVPTAYAEGRIICFLSQVYDPQKGLLGVDIGASSVTIAAGFGGELTLGVYPQLGLGEGLSNLLRYTSVEDILKWIVFDIPPEAVREYLYQKALYPFTVPVTPEDLAIEQALVRQALHIALNNLAKDFPLQARRPAAGMLPYFEPILAAGSVLTHAPSLGQSLLMLLDGLQPTGITTLILDQNNLLPALGAAAARNHVLPIQVLESGAFLGLATVVAPCSTARPGSSILHVHIIYPNGNESRLEIKQGTLEVLPLPIGERAHLFLKPARHVDVGFGPGRAPSEGIPLTGTALGVVIDARGRPLRLPADAGRRRELIKKWQWTLGG